MPPKTPPATPQHELSTNEQKLILCAKLSKFAYTSATPNLEISVDKKKARRRLDDLLKEAGRRPISIEGHETCHFERFASHSWLRALVNKLRWWRSHNEFKWWRSHSYFYHFQEKDKNTIVVAFRGTWMGEGTNGWKADDKTPFWLRYGPITWYNAISRRLSPSNYGLSDIYYDAFIMRIPYTDGTVWKWFAYWGSIVLESTRWATWPPLSWLFIPSRLSAADWISRPDQDRIVPSNRVDTEPANTPNSDETLEPATCSSPPPTQDPSAPIVPRNRGTVHLGFWALWATPEGFAGYDTKSRYQEEKQRRMLHEVKVALESRVNDKETEILVVGHSLGGAVSCFAALDLVHRLEKWKAKNVTIFHATFGAPPVGDPSFQAYFNCQFNQPQLTLSEDQTRHESWSIYHEWDVVASCFAWCGTKWQVKWLGWWGDWRGVGRRVRLGNLSSDRDTPPSAPASDEHPASEPPGNKILASGSSSSGSSASEPLPTRRLLDGTPTEEPAISEPATGTGSPDDAPSSVRGWWTKMKGWLTKVTSWLSHHALLLVSCFVIAVLTSLYVLNCVLDILVAFVVYSPWYAVRRMTGWQNRSPRQSRAREVAVRLGTRVQMRS